MALLLTLSGVLSLTPATITEVHASFFITEKALTRAPLSTSTITALIAHAALKYSLSYADLYGTLSCESDTRFTGGRELDQEAVGDHGTSFGLAQIHLSAHPAVTKAQAFDPRFAIEFAAKAFSQGHAGWWSCYTKLQKN